MKFVAMRLVALMAFVLLLAASCAQTAADVAPMRVAALPGPTAFGLVPLMSENAADDAPRYDFSILGSPDEVAPLLVRGEVDAAVVPANLAAVLHNRMDGAVQALAVVTLGVLHIVETTGDIRSIADLAGRTVVLFGQGATPDIALRYVLQQNDLVPDVDVTLEFVSEHPQVAAMLESGQADVALLPEPFVSTVLAQIPGTRAALDLTAEWDRVQPEFGLIMSVVVVRREFADAHPQVIQDFLADYADSIYFMQTNTAQGAALAVDFGIVPSAAIAEAALPRSNLVFWTGDTLQRNLTNFLWVLYAANPDSIGGGVPGEDFFRDAP